MAEHPHIWGAAMIGHAEALAALGIITADADTLRRAESAYATLATSAAGTFSRLVVAYAWSGRGNVLKSLAAMTGAPEFLDAAANAKRQARSRFEAAGSGRGVADMERELDAIYAEIRTQAVPSALALTG